ncbi:MAG: hypothetical protein J5496_06935 [Lachnospiraceae bacterium]|nr:hypothetical protein [Lachnospiraceae bacterium]
MLMLLQLAGCGGDTGSTTRSPQQKETTASAGTRAPSTSAPQTEPETEAPHIPPQTAVLPPAQTLKELTHLSGVMDTWFDPESGREYSIWEDLGEDGHTRTMNCFDDEEKLVWWEAYEYDGNEEIVRKLRWNPDKSLLLSREELYRENGTLVRMEHYDYTYPDGTPTDWYLSAEEEYYANGSPALRKVYYPYCFYGFYAVEHQYEYGEDGQELHHLVYDEAGTVIEEYVNGEKQVVVPDSLADIYRLLNETSAEEFETVWEACQTKIAQKNMSDKWEKLCHSFSALMDEYHGSRPDGILLYRLREEYGLGLFRSASNAGGLYRSNTPSLYDVWNSVTEGEVNPLLFAKIYRRGCCLDFGGTLWLPEEFSRAASARSTDGLLFSDEGTQKSLNWSSNDLRAFLLNGYGYDPLPDYEAAGEQIPDDRAEYFAFCVRLTETIAQKLGTDAETLLESYEAHLDATKAEPDAAAPRQERKPIRILVVDTSATIRGDEITPEMLISEDSEAESIVERAETILKGLFSGVSDYVILTSYPELADVVLLIDTTYPFAGQYKYSSGTIANVWNTVVSVTAYEVNGEREVSAVFKHLAGQTVSVTGGTKIYMRVPELTKEEYAEDAHAFTSAVMSWFPDLPL